MYTGDYLISMSSLRGASEGSCHSAATSESPEAKHNRADTIQAQRHTRGAQSPAFSASSAKVKAATCAFLHLCAAHHQTTHHPEQKCADYPGNRQERNQLFELFSLQKQGTQVKK